MRTRSPSLYFGLYVIVSIASDIKNGSCFLNTLLGANWVTRLTRLFIVFTNWGKSLIYVQVHFSSKYL